MKAVVERLIRDPETGILVVTVGSSAQFNPELAVAPIVDAVREAPADAAPSSASPCRTRPKAWRCSKPRGCRTSARWKPAPRRWR